MHFTLACYAAQTILYAPSTSIYLLERHHERLSRTATSLGFASATRDELRERVLASVGSADGAYRVRIVSHANGTLAVNTTPLALPHDGFPNVDPTAVPLRVVLDSVRLDTSRASFCHKTTARRIYDDARSRVGCAPIGVVDPTAPFDVLLANERDELTETGMANIALENARGEPWVTPALSCGLVDGVMRRELLHRGQLIEGVVTVQQLLAAAAMRPDVVQSTTEWFPRIFCFNAVRGIYEVELARGKLVSDWR